MHIFGVHLLGRYCSLSSFPFGLMDNNTNGRQWDSVPVGYTSALEHVFTGPGCSVAGAVGADWCDRAKCSFICLNMPHSLIHSFVHPFIYGFFSVNHTILKKKWNVSLWNIILLCLFCGNIMTFQCLHSYKLHFFYRADYTFLHEIIH